MEKKKTRKNVKQKNKERKENTKVIKAIKITTVILLIVLLVMIGFFGIYKQSKNQMINVLKDFSYSMDINGARVLKLTLNSENGDDVKTAGNYKKAKEVIEKRLKDQNIGEYKIRLNEQTGEIVVEIPENTNTDTIVSNLTTIGKFEISDSETKDVLLDNNSIKSSRVLYNTTSSGTQVYLEIAFNKNGKNKLEEISKTYVEGDNNTTSNETAENTAENVSTETENVTNETENATNTENSSSTSSTSSKKQITMKIDDEEIMTTSFDEPITTGKIQLSVGKASTDTKTINGYVTQAQAIATELDSGNLPVKYDLSKNQYVLSEITHQQLLCAAIVVEAIAVIGLIIIAIKYKTNGILADIAYIGLAAIYLIVLRYTNVVISLESILAIITVLVINYIFTVMLLKNIKEMKKEKEENIVNKATRKTNIKLLNNTIPLDIMTIVFCFAKWVPLNTFGMTAFWGLALMAIYNASITRYLLKTKVESK